MGPIVGFAVTVIIQPSIAKHQEGHEAKWREYRAYIASRPEPKIVVVQDLDKPHFVGAYWGEVMSNAHRALGCVGTIIDGAIRDVDEMRSAGFKALAKQTTIGHAYSTPIRWDCEVEVFGCPVRPGQLIHADQHGFLVIPEKDEAELLEACRFMDAAECHTLISAGRNTAGRSMAEVLHGMEEGMRVFNSMVTKRFADGGA
jgi:regulator of RNase E activity RraA